VAREMKEIFQTDKDLTRLRLYMSGMGVEATSIAESYPCRGRIR
jgi:hypothetical protein